MRAPRREGLLGGAVLLALVLLALLADVLSADAPVLLRLEGRVWVLPAHFGPVELREATLAEVSARLEPARGDWLLAPLRPHGAGRSDLGAVLSPPDGTHWLGTDELGRDVLARLLHGARVSLAVGVATVALQVLLGALLGALAGLLGGWVDALLSRLMDVLLSVPAFLLVLCVLGLMPDHSLLTLAAVLGLVRWPDVARLVRAEVRRARQEGWAEAAVALGAGPVRLLRVHLLPASFPPLQVAVAFGVANAILTESALSFLGYGVPLGTPSWGELLTQAHRHLLYPGAWWLALFPGLALFLTVAGLHLVGESLRAARLPGGR